MKLFLKISLFIFTMLTTVGEATSSIVKTISQKEILQSIAYDPNGNLTADSRKATTYTYNTLNRLKEVRENGALKAHYTWLADGAKLRVRDAAGNGFDYLGSLTYISTYAGLQLEAANFPGGIIRAVSANTQEINCLITDHLGSVRAVIDQNGTILEQNDYIGKNEKRYRRSHYS